MKSLIQRLNKIQREMKATKGRMDPSGKFSYRSAEDILQAAKPFLGIETVIMLKDQPVEIGGKLYMKATAAITDGEHTLSADGYAEIPDKIMAMSAPQISGSCSSYARKYAMQGLFALDDNPEIDSLAQYAEELEDFRQAIEDNAGFRLYMMTSNWEAEAQAAVWNMYKKEYIPKGEIGLFRQRISDLKQQGRTEALAAQEAFADEDESAAAEALAEYTTEEIEFINGLQA